MSNGARIRQRRYGQSVNCLASMRENLQLDFRSLEQHVLGNGMRFDKVSGIHLDERWCAHLNTRDLHVFDKIAGKLNKAYGYL